MDFTFTEDQLLFQSTVREFLLAEVTPERIRTGWESDTGRDPGLWRQLAELGLTGMSVPEEHGGLGMTALDFVLLAQECGYVALPEPLVHTALVAAPLLRDIGGQLASDWLPRIAAGEARVAVGLEQNLLVEDAHVADLLLLQRGDAWYALDPGQVGLRHNESVDPSRRLYAVEMASGAGPLVRGEEAAQLSAASGSSDEMATTMGISEDAARMRNKRAQLQLASTLRRLRNGDLDAFLDGSEP